MVIVQSSNRLYIREFIRQAGDPAIKEAYYRIWQGVNTVQLGIDVSWDIFITVSTVLFGVTMLRHPRFGKILGSFGIILGLATLTLNPYTFPVPPKEDGSCAPSPQNTTKVHRNRYRNASPTTTTCAPACAGHNDANARARCPHNGRKLPCALMRISGRHLSRTIAANNWGDHKPRGQHIHRNRLWQRAPQHAKQRRAQRPPRALGVALHDLPRDKDGGEPPRPVPAPSSGCPVWWRLRRGTLAAGATTPPRGAARWGTGSVQPRAVVGGV